MTILIYMLLIYTAISSMLHCKFAASFSVFFSLMKSYMNFPQYTDFSYESLYYNNNLLYFNDLLSSHKIYIYNYMYTWWHEDILSYIRPEK